ncbi:hypothetical protein [Algiphilus aromaticivorans]|uniref:hypothetical protein n=1 Tax=Algiphilus aromaticivorans TaxID=382454 RepID=UPI0005C1FA0C|nr:hypothetical protein [Algiphilus aromaticivorans]
MNDTTDFARGSDPLGKATAECKAWICEDANDSLAMLACAEGKSKSEYVRDLIYEHLWGRATMTKLLIQRGRGSAGTGPAEGR